MVNESAAGLKAINIFVPGIFSSTLGIGLDNSVIAMVPVMSDLSIGAALGGLGFMDKMNLWTAMMGVLGEVSILLALLRARFSLYRP